jgi:hypothetical protein
MLSYEVKENVWQHLKEIHDYFLLGKGTVNSFETGF